MNKDKEMVKQKEEILNQQERDVDRNRWLINYLTNQPLPNTSSIQETVNEFEKLLNQCKSFCSVLDEKKASIIYLLLKNRVSYFGEVKRLLALNSGSIAFLIGAGDGESYAPGWFEKKGIIRKINEKEFEHEKKFFEKNVRHSIKRFFCLTDNAREFYSNIQGELERLSKNVALINHLHERMQIVKSQVSKEKILENISKQDENRKKEAFNKLIQKIDEIQEEFAKRKENNSFTEFRKELIKLKETEFKKFPELINERLRMYYKHKWTEEKWGKYLEQIRHRWETLAYETNG